MPQARSSGSRSTSSARSKSSSGRSTAKRSTAASGRSTAKRSSAASGRSRTKGTSTKSKAGASDARLEAAAQRLRKLNERIIDAGKEAGETTLSSYEKALKSIASTIERGPGKSDIDWLSNLATAQAKFIRDVTEAWTSAARKALK